VARIRLCRLWQWLGREPTPRRRLLAFLVVVGMFSYTVWALQDIVHDMETDQQRRRIAAVGDRYAGCLATNRIVDAGEQMVRALRLLNPNPTPEQAARTEQTIVILSAPWATGRRDCDASLRDFSPQERAQIKSTTTLPVPTTANGN
jgi:hypothetical protein